MMTGVPSQMKLTEEQRHRAIQVLKASPMFHLVGEKNLDVIVNSMDLIDCKAGELIYEQGSKTTRMYIVVDGVIDRVRFEDGTFLSSKKKKCFVLGFWEKNSFGIFDHKLLKWCFEFDLNLI